MDVEYIRHRIDGDGIVGDIVVARALVPSHICAEERSRRELARMLEFPARGCGRILLHVDHPVPVHLRGFALFSRAHRCALVADVAYGREIFHPAGLRVRGGVRRAVARRMRKRDLAPDPERRLPDAVRLV